MCVTRPIPSLARLCVPNFNTSAESDEFWWMMMSANLYVGIFIRSHSLDQSSGHKTRPSAPPPKIHPVLPPPRSLSFSLFYGNPRARFPSYIVTHNMNNSECALSASRLFGPTDTAVITAFISAPGMFGRDKTTDKLYIIYYGSRAPDNTISRCVPGRVPYRKIADTGPAGLVLSTNYVLYTTHYRPTRGPLSDIIRQLALSTNNLFLYLWKTNTGTSACRSYSII